MSSSDKSTATSVPRKTFICDICDKAFISAKSLGGHRKVHRKAKELKGEGTFSSAPSTNSQKRFGVPQRRANHAPQPRVLVPVVNGADPHSGYKYHPYARPNHGDQPEEKVTLDLISKICEPFHNVRAGRLAETWESCERTVSDVQENINGEGVMNNSEGLDLELKL